MGFYINEITYELKQHLNLSEMAWDIIYNDMGNFYGEDNKPSFSGFLNRIFYNFYQDSNASIGIRALKYREELATLFSNNPEAFSNDANAEQIISLLVNKHENELLEKACAYPKAIGKKFRINRQNIEVLKESTSATFYDDSIGSYLKAVFEEYATLSSAQRESIFFKDTIDTCNFAIAQRRKIKISLSQRLSNKRNTVYTRKFYVTPCFVLPDKNRIFNYLVGISEEIKSDGSVDEKRISSFRISRIKKISIMNSMSGFLSHQKTDEIQKEIQSKSLPYMAGDLITLEVAFTNKGLELFNRHLYLRPTTYTKINSNTYSFNCTELQAIHYFFKFGRDAHIIKPQYLQDKFKAYYQEALNAYSGK